MTSADFFCEQRGAYIVEAGAVDLGHGEHWQPWVKLAQLGRADGVSAGRMFDGLKPVFGTREAALRYATELGRKLADEGIDLFPASPNGGSAAWRPNPAAGRQRASHAHAHRGRSGSRSARCMIGALAGLFARTVSAAGLYPRQHMELYLAAAASHAELEQRMRAVEWWFRSR